MNDYHHQLNRWWFHFQDASFKAGYSCTSPNKTSAVHADTHTHNPQWGYCLLTYRHTLMRCTELTIWRGEKTSAWAKYTHPSLIMCERYFSCWFLLFARPHYIHTPNISELAMGSMYARVHSIEIIIQLETEEAAATTDVVAERKYGRCVAYFLRAIQKFK